MDGLNGERWRTGTTYHLELVWVGLTPVIGQLYQTVDCVIIIILFQK